MSNVVKYKIYVDCGHAITTSGKETPLVKQLGRKIKEAEFNYAVGKKLIALCKKYNIESFDVSPDIKVDIPLGTRVNRINNDFRTFMAQNGKNKAVVVSIHYNAHLNTFEGSGASGVETYHNIGSVEGKKLAESVHKELIKGTKQVNRGVKSSDFTIIATTTPTAILIEAGFMDSEFEAELMLNDSFQSEVASEIFNGVLNYWGIKVSDLTPKPIPNPTPISTPIKPQPQPQPCKECDVLKAENTALKSKQVELEAKIKQFEELSKHNKLELGKAHSKITNAIYELTK